MKFTKKGSYSYYCTIHPGQKGTVKVVAKGKPIPSNKANAKAAKKEYAKVVKRLIKDAKFAGPPGNEVVAGNDTTHDDDLPLLPDDEVGPGRHDGDLLDVGEDDGDPHDLVRPGRLPEGHRRRVHRARPGDPSGPPVINPIARVPERRADAARL